MNEKVNKHFKTITFIKNLSIFFRCCKAEISEIYVLPKLNQNNIRAILFPYSIPIIKESNADK